MADFEVSKSVEDSAAPAASLESGPYAAILKLVRLLARQAARDDYARALEGGRSKSYSTPGADTIKES